MNDKGAIGKATNHLNEHHDQETRDMEISMLRATLFDLINIIEDHCQQGMTYPTHAMERANDVLMWTQNS